ncbi:hypothetical protein GCM10023262_06150 [Bartonella pachyuromydis]|uniref:Uncharacterized protein n=1 Tax=Bartonella pachyuromydis TaxID=931097 RepID=A0ABP8VED6_9HYPH
MTSGPLVPLRRGSSTFLSFTIMCALFLDIRYSFQILSPKNQDAVLHQSKRFIIEASSTLYSKLGLP